MRLDQEAANLKEIEQKSQVQLEVPTDSGNYAISYLIPVLQVQTGTKNVPAGVDELEITLPFDLIGPLYSVIAEFQNPWMALLNSNR